MATIPDPYARSTFHGKPLDNATIARLKQAEKRLGYELTILQGIGGATASAGTHTQGRAIDLAPWDQANKVRVLRDLGFAAWFRPTLPGVWSDHIHAVLIFDGRGNQRGVAPAAWRQIQSYDRGRNGLANDAADPNPYRPTPARGFSMDDYRATFAEPKPEPRPKPKPEPKPTGPTRTRRGGSWNLRVGRNPDVVAREVQAFLKEHDLGFFAICEAAEYIDALTDSLKGYKVYAKFDGDGPARDSAVIARDGLNVTDLRVHRLERIGWERKPGRIGLHWPRSAVSVDVEGLRVTSVHMPPGPFQGPKFWRRGVAFDTSAHKLRRIGLRWSDRPWVMAGDWNVGKRVVGTEKDPSAAWIASETGARIKGDGIDYAMYHGCRVTDFKRIDFGTSDHPPITFVVSTKEN